MDIALSYIEKGEGFPLILLHGNGENKEYFIHQIEYFSKQYRVIAIDTRGHGASKRGNKPFTLKQFAEDLKNFLDSLKISKVYILGFSDGGNIALLFSLKYPHYVEKLILNGANLHPSGVRLHVQLPVYLGYGLVSAISFIDKRAVPKKEMLALMVNQPNITEHELAKLSIPTLVIAGKKDMIKEEHTKRIANGIKRSSLSIIDGDHFIANKNSKLFNETVENFLNA